MSEPPFIQPAAFLRWFFLGSFWRINGGEKIVYLTFDDGPHPVITEWVLSQLEIYKQKATFFCIGKNVDAHTSVLKNVIEKGNAIGNHSYSHNKNFVNKNQAFFDDINKCQSLLKTNLFRPPYGKIKFSQFYKLRKHFNIIFWDVLSYDYSDKYSGEDCAHFVKKYLRNGSIITFHDSEKAFPRLKIALPIVLEYLKENGYKSIPIQFN